MSPEELKTVLALHRKWLAGEEGGRRADLRGANLRNADLSDADLSYANLRYANLRNAALSNANLSNADLRGAEGILEAACEWTDHGECGRQLMCVLIDDSPRYYCGCFSGTEQELREYIAKGEEKLKASRTLAADFVSTRMTEMIEARKLEGGAK